MLLAGPEPTEALGVFVESRAPLLFSSLFGVLFINIVYLFFFSFFYTLYIY